MQLFDRLRSAVLDRIRDADEPGRLPVDGDEHDRLTVGAKLFGAGGQRPGVDPEVLQHRAIAERDVVARDAAFHSLTRDGLEVLGVAERDTSLLRALDDRGRQRMLAASFEARRESEEISLLARRAPQRRSRVWVCLR